MTGSLTDARKLADRLGDALAVIVLLAAFVIAVLLTLSSVGKRVREIGTLFVITHDGEVARHARRRIRLRDGEVVSDTAA